MSVGQVFQSKGAAHQQDIVTLHSTNFEKESLTTIYDSPESIRRYSLLQLRQTTAKNHHKRAAPDLQESGVHHH